MLKKVFYIIFFLVGFEIVSQPLMRISVENPESHVQAHVVRVFVEKLQKRLLGKLSIELYTGAQLFRDQNIVTALATGRVEMAVPGTWQIDKHVPEVGIFTLPEFYGRKSQDIYFLNSSALGQLINSRIEEGIGVKVIGDWIDLGHVLIFSTSNAIRTYNDFDSRKIRVAGGMINQWRIKSLGAEPVVIAFPDLPEKLSQGGIDGVLTSYETIRSAELWNNGIKNAFEDNQYFAQYIPMISIDFWNRLSPDVQLIIVETWKEGVIDARIEAAISQKESKNLFIKNGGKVYLPTEIELKNIRQQLINNSNSIRIHVGIPTDVLDSVNDFFKER
ncbi:MAG: TRAP transporter substrate-binding protein DctP [Spirochaetales bacterium]|nr:TRAP transporter substrate-binding protein DctP [Spirochaetales bacterium]